MDLVVSVGRKKTSDSKRQFFTEVKAESVFRIVFILWVSPCPDLPQPQRCLTLLSGATHQGLWLQSSRAESA